MAHLDPLHHGDRASGLCHAPAVRHSPALPYGSQTHSLHGSLYHLHYGLLLCIKGALSLNWRSSAILPSAEPWTQDCNENADMEDVVRAGNVNEALEYWWLTTMLLVGRDVQELKKVLEERQALTKRHRGKGESHHKRAPDYRGMSAD